MPEVKKPIPQTEIWGYYDKMNRRLWFATVIGLAIAALPAILLTDGLPIEQRLVWISCAVVIVTLWFAWLLQNSSGEPWSTTSLAAAEAALAEVVGDPAVMVAVWESPDLEQRLQDVQGLSTLTVPPTALLAVGPLGLAVGPAKPTDGVTQFIERHRVDDLRVTETERYEQWPSVTVTLRSRPAVPVTIQFAPASRIPVSRWGVRSYRPPQADEREVRELVAAMRSTLGI